MIKGLMITPPVIGRIAIGKVVERNGKRLPEKDDEFTITTQVQSRGQWILHPLDEALRLAAAQSHGGIKEGSSPSVPDGVLDDAQGISGHASASSSADTGPGSPGEAIRSSNTVQTAARVGRRSLKEKMGIANAGDAAGETVASTVPSPAATQARRKLRNIPVRVLFNDPDLNLRAHYTLFDRTTARPVCVGDGESCKRVTSKGLESMPCPGPDACAFGKDGCKPYGRLNLAIGDSDELGSFVFRTTGFNSIRTLTARLQYFAAVSGGYLACMPLELKLRGKSTTQSHRSAIYYADLVVRTGLSLNEAIVQAKELAGQRLVAGVDQTALDAAARLGYANGSFEDSPDEAAEIVEEFYPEESQASTVPATAKASGPWATGSQAKSRNGTHSPYP
ncbi:Phage capsid protein [Comamonas aquatilis]|uniref:recombination directionality factor n=1 Tax=Comamonas aquatilis TaxID=1778406 RepID=UPI0039EF6EC1